MPQQTCQKRVIDKNSEQLRRELFREIFRKTKITLVELGRSSAGMGISVYRTGHTLHKAGLHGRVAGELDTLEKIIWQNVWNSFPKHVEEDAVTR